MKYQEPTKLVDYGSMAKLLQLELDRTAKTPLAEQIRNGIECAAMAEPRAFSARRTQVRASSFNHRWFWEYRWAKFRSILQ